jgi:hypothetical protein
MCRPPHFSPIIQFIAQGLVVSEIFCNFGFAEVTDARKSKEKTVFLWLFARLIVTLHVFKRF